MLKHKLTDSTILYGKNILHRIIALSGFGMFKTRHCIVQVGKYYYIRWQWLYFWGYITQPMELWATDEIVDAPLKFRSFSLAEAYLAYWLENKLCKDL